MSTVICCGALQSCMLLLLWPGLVLVLPKHCTVWWALSAWLQRRHLESVLAVGCSVLCAVAEAPDWAAAGAEVAACAALQQRGRWLPNGNSSVQGAWRMRAPGGRVVTAAALRLGVVLGFLFVCRLLRRLDCRTGPLTCAMVTRTVLRICRGVCDSLLYQQAHSHRGLLLIGHLTEGILDRRQLNYELGLMGLAAVRRVAALRAA